MKRQRNDSSQNISRTKRKITKGGSSTYQTVPRTRGVYSLGEHKYFDQAVNQTVARSSTWTGAMADDGTALTMFVPTQGAGINQRIGREVNIHKIRVFGYVQLTGGNDLAGQIVFAQGVRVLLAQDMQTNATQMVSQDLMDGSSANATITAFQNINNFGRFRVLKDKLLLLQDPNFAHDATTATLSDTNGLMRPFKFSINFKKPVRVRFNATNGGTVADIVDNSFHLLANARTYGGSDAGQPTVSISYRSRVVYTDA